MKNAINTVSYTHLDVYKRQTDDILDVTGTIEELGKTPGSDVRQHKSTYVSLLGLEGAKEQASSVGKQAHDALNSVSYDTSILAALIDYLLKRTN